MQTNLQHMKPIYLYGYGMCIHPCTDACMHACMHACMFEKHPHGLNDLYSRQELGQLASGGRDSC